MTFWSDQQLCPAWQEKISGFMDHELSTLEAAEVKEHLAGCRACRDIFAELEHLSRKIHAQGREIPPPPPLASLTARLSQDAAGLSDHVSAPEKDPAAGWGPYSHHLAAGLAATLILAASAALLSTGLPWTGRDAGLTEEAGSGLTAPDDAVHGGKTGEALSVPFSFATGDSPVPPTTRESAGRPGAGAPTLDGLPALAGFLSSHRAEAVPASMLASHLSFTPRIPQQLPGGFQLAESYLIHDLCCAGSCLLYRRGKEVVGLVQQPPSHPLPWPTGRIIQQVLAGVSCRRSLRDGVDVIQIDPEGRNLTLVYSGGTEKPEEMVSYLAGNTR
ncbi:MAG: anti-sigma factor family protein [Acidobacteriota bacterium]